MEVVNGTVLVFPLVELDEVLFPPDVLPLLEVLPLPPFEDDVDEPPDLPVLLSPPFPPPPPPLRRSKRFDFERLVRNGINMVECERNSFPAKRLDERGRKVGNPLPGELIICGSSPVSDKPN